MSISTLHKGDDDDDDNNNNNNNTKKHTEIKQYVYFIMLNQCIYSCTPHHQRVTSQQVTTHLSDVDPGAIYPQGFC